MDELRQILWAPWRMEYILGEKSDGCVFCDKPALDDDREALIVHRGQHCYVILNYYPYNNGHLMVVPFRHVAELEDLTAEERIELIDLTALSLEVLKKAISPHGFNLGLNLGSVAGAGVSGHVHLHVVPRWEGDTNFMPVIGHTKVVNEGLWETWDKLAPLFRERSGS